MKIPLEDTYADILSKARRGLGLDLETLSTKAGVPSELANQILSGSFDEPGVRALAAVLNLHPDRVAAIGRTDYRPAEIPLMDGTLAIQHALRRHDGQFLPDVGSRQQEGRRL